jgi:hypothetical protein
MGRMISWLPAGLSIAGHRWRTSMRVWLVVLVYALSLASTPAAAEDCALVFVTFGPACGCSQACGWILCDDGSALFLGCSQPICTVCV